MNPRRVLAMCIIFCAAGLVGSATSRASVVGVAATSGGGFAGSTGTGIAVNAGEILSICAEGRIDLRNLGPRIGPAGESGVAAPADYWVPTAPPGALIGTIDAGPEVSFYVGECFLGAAPGSGNLRLGVNDAAGAYADNSGAFTVTIGGGTAGAPVPRVASYAISGPSTGGNWQIGLSPAGAATCISTENNGQDLTFEQHHNTRGGCGWHTKAPHLCKGDANRSCHLDEDCLGICKLTSNPPLSTFDACSPSFPACVDRQQCNPLISTTNILGACATDADCGGLPGSCELVAQTCVDYAGTCDLASTNSVGGIWHTGAIGGTTGDCSGRGIQCKEYGIITTTFGILRWYEVLRTPIIEQVNQGTGTGPITVKYTKACESTNNNISYGAIADLGNFPMGAGVQCNVGNDGEVSFNPPIAGSYYFLLVANNGSIEGSYGKNSANMERPANPDHLAMCGVTKNLANRCDP